MNHSIRFASVVSFLALSAALTACNPNDESDFSQNVQTPPAAPQEFHHVKYPAGVIYEGGKGDPTDDSLTARTQPLWRFYLCFERSSAPVAKQVDIDFAKLGQPVFINWGDDDSQPPQATRRLDQLHLRYQYTAALADDLDPSDPANSPADGSYVTADATFSSSSQQRWKTVSQAPGFDFPSSWPTIKDFDIFDSKVNDGSAEFHSYFTYTLKGVGYYVTRTFVRATISDQDRSHVIKACERNDKPSFSQVGAAITPLND